MTFKPFMIARVGMVLILLLAGSSLALGQSEFVIYHVPNSGLLGAGPVGSMVSDMAGNLYGTNFQGDAFFAGNVFELVRPVPPKKQWIQKVLHTFSGNGDGANPRGGVIFDSAGNLYGTTSEGGTFGFGTVFQLAPPATSGGDWTETILYSFFGGGSNDGAEPVGGLALDTAGNLYGTTYQGGFTNYPHCTQGCGTVFQLLAPSATRGGWTEKVIQTFHPAGGSYPLSGVVIDARGNLYGTGTFGGLNSQGVVYRLTSPATEGGTWAYRVLYAFGANTTDSAQPWGGLTLHGNGLLYGTASTGGAFNDGTVFQLVPPVVAGGAWTENILHSFGGNDGDFPAANLIFDKTGNIYSTTMKGGLVGCGLFGCGTVFRLNPPASSGASWTETLLHEFPTTQTDGLTPSGGLILGKNGVLYGATQSGVTNTDGTIFGVTP